MKKNIIITVIDLLVYLINDILGWFVFVLLTFTDDAEKYQMIYMTTGIIHIIISIITSVLFFMKERTRFKIRIGKDLFIYNLIMTLSPYLFLALFEYYQINFAV